jgi:hypothetical protein
MEFRVYFLGQTGLIDGPSAGFEAEDDEAALQIARGMYWSAEWSEGGFELWQGTRLVQTWVCQKIVRDSFP